MSIEWGDDTLDWDRDDRDEPKEHLWHDRVFASMNIRCCMRCGFIQNEDKPNKPCPGWVRVGTREASI